MRSIRRSIGPVVALVALLAAAPGCSNDEPGDQTIVIVGDSVTNLSRQEIGDELDWARSLTVRAQNGATTEELLPLARDGIEAAGDPDIGVFLPGYNDILKEQADTEALDEMVAVAAELPCVVWLLLPTHGAYSPDEVEVWNARLEQAAEEHDSIHLSSDWKRLVENSPDYTFVSDRDGVHPNKEGQIAIAKVMSDQARDRCT